MPNLLSILALVLNALVWGVSWWPFRQLDPGGLHPLWATALMYALGLARLSGHKVSRRSLVGALVTLAGVALFFR